MKTKDLRIGIYVRVSTQDQSTEIQKNELLEYCRARNWQKIQIFSDKSSGTKAERTGLKQLQNEVFRRKVDLVLCWKLDRLFRSLKHLISTLQSFEEAGVGFIALRDNVDLTTSQGRLMMHMLGAFGEFEASLIRERVRAGVRAKIARTGQWGPKPRINPQDVKDLRAKGYSLRRIAATLGIAKSSVQRALA